MLAFPKYNKNTKQYDKINNEKLGPRPIMLLAAAVEIGLVKVQEFSI